MGAFTGLYGMLWRGARPLLRRHKRLREDFANRLVPPDWATDGPVDVWIQAASGGESFLARQLMGELGAMHAANPGHPPLRLLCTSCTRQGLDTLTAAAAWAQETYPGLRVFVRVFPLDEPDLMATALDYTSPSLVVLLETELWPGLMASCALRNIPMAVLNGRMTEKSLKGYRMLKPFWKRTAPAAIRATTEQDAARFAELFGKDVTDVMPNMKFDAVGMGAAVPDSPSPVESLLPKSSPVLLLASVREQEEAMLLPLVDTLRRDLPDSVIVVAPRHMERVDAWRNGLAERIGNSGCVLLRSELAEKGVAAQPGQCVVWNAFGELRALYGRAKAVFVGGSLAPLGGQNFLEPAFEGVAPVIGPHWKNFLWVGQAFFDAALATRVADTPELARVLTERMRAPAQDRDAVRAGAEAYVAPRLGGTRIAACAVMDLLAGAQPQNAAIFRNPR